MPAHLIELRICQHCIFPCPGFLPLIQGLRPKWKGQQLPCILVLNKPCPLKRQRSTLGRMLECFAATEAPAKEVMKICYPHGFDLAAAYQGTWLRIFKPDVTSVAVYLYLSQGRLGLSLNKRTGARNSWHFPLNWFDRVLLKYKIYSLVKDVTKYALSYDQNFNCFPWFVAQNKHLYIHPSL